VAFRTDRDDQRRDADFDEVNNRKNGAERPRPIASGGICYAELVGINRDAEAAAIAMPMTKSQPAMRRTESAFPMRVIHLEGLDERRT
jgi:hypothetical protein